MGIALSIFVTSASAEEAANLEKIESYTKGSVFITELVFDRPVSSQVSPEDIEYINQTVQVNIPGVNVPSGKTLVRVQDEAVRSIFAYQLTENILRARVIHNKPILAKDLKGLVNVSLDDKV